jgi:HEAT repeat protein
MNTSKGETMKKLASVSKQKLTGTNLESLMEMLASKDGVTRTKARKSLVALGKPAVPYLTRILRNSKLDHLRWEAAKILGTIGDAKAIPPLVKALEDSDQDVAWLAAIALKKFKKAAWPTLLRVLIRRRSDSVLLRKGAHHVLRNQKEDGFNDLLATLTKALESDTVPESTAIAAYDILKQMKVKS